MSAIVLVFQVIQELLSGKKTVRLFSVLKLLFISYLFFQIYTVNGYSLQKLIAIGCFFCWFSFWEIKNGKSSIYPAFIILATQSLALNENATLLIAMASMAIYSYANFYLKNKYGVSNLIGLILVLCPILLLFLGVSEYLTIWLIVGLLFSINWFYNPFINNSSHKTEFLLALVLFFLYLEQMPFNMHKYTLILFAFTIVFMPLMIFLERKRMELVCISQLSIHLILVSKSTMTYFFYSVAVVYIIWILFEYISRNNNDFLSKIIILIFASDLPFTPFFISKLKTFSYLYIEGQWLSFALIVLFSLVVTGNILVYSYRSLISFAKVDKEEKTSTKIYVQRTAIAVFLLFYTLAPLILFKQ